MRLPMFPIGGVLLPGELLPLHVFEERYRRLVHDCLASTSELGIVLIERGSEVGGGDVRFDVGCLARISDSVQLPDGRWALLLAGVERLRVREWLPDAPYPVADVAPWPDEGPELADRVAEMAPGLRRVLAMAAEAGDHVAPAPDEITTSWMLAALAPLGPLDRLALLRAGSPDVRLDLLADMLGDAEAVLAARLGGG